MGLTQANNVVLKSLLQQQLDFQSAPMFIRNQTYLMSRLEDQDLILFIYATEFVINPAIRLILKRSLASILNYQNSITRIYVLLFTFMCFALVVALFLFIFVLFKRMKKTMIDCNILLKILPAQYIDAMNQEKLKAFILS